MIASLLLAALTVSSTADLGCPDRAMLLERLRSQGVIVREEDDVRVRFSLENERRVAEIDVPGATTRRLEHAGPDCDSLAEGTVALLSVLLDERELREPPPRLPTERPSHALFRFDAGAITSSGIVAPLAVGATIGFTWQALPWGSIGILGETWPERAHAVDGGAVTVSASSAALVGCVGRLWRRLSLEGCVLAQVGGYELSAEAFPIVRSESRAFFGGEADARAAFALVRGVGVFIRTGIWLPLTRLDVAVRGSDAGFRTTSVGPKAALGVELSF